MTWEQGRQLTSVTYNNKTTNYQYNSDGIRTKKTNNDGSYVVYYLANGKAIGETHFDANNAVQYYLRYTFDETGSVVGFSHWGTNGHWQDYYFVKNLQGDVLQVYSEFYGTCVASYTYDSWGNILSSSGSFANINPFRYRTYYYDSETWFYYLQSRYYDPSIGRFINADSFVSTGQGILGYNMFAYCNNNPVMRIDPTGEIGIFAILGMAALLVSIAVFIPSSNVNTVAQTNESPSDNLTLYSEHQKKGTTNPSNKNKHQKGNSRRQRDNGGEKKNKNPNWKPNPNRRKLSKAETNTSLGERLFLGGVAVGTTIVVVYLVANDLTGIGISDDWAIPTLLPLIWDNAAKAIS